MSKEDNGGPAFPVVVSSFNPSNGEVMHFENEHGISTRDYFAAKAMQGFCAGPDGGINPTSGIDVNWQASTARVSYEVADAMLAARRNHEDK